MKKSLVTFLLVVVAAAAAQQPTSAPPADQQQPAAQAAPAQQPGAAPAQQKKEIKDPAEYNAYVAAVQAQDPQQKISGIEAFLQTYPNSVMKEDATELLMKTYQQTGNMQKTIDTGQKLLQISPNNLTALALLTFNSRAQAQQPGPNAAQALEQAGQFGQRGEQALQTAPKPEGISDADWAKFKQQADLIFSGAIGHAALQAKNYPVAQQNLLKVVQANPNSFTDVYLLALSYLQVKPTPVEGLFWISRAAAIAPAQAAPQITAYAKSSYTRYHGTEEGFDQLLAAAKGSPTVPAGFTVAPAPSPAEQAAQMLQKTPPAKMSFAEWQFVLTSGNQQAADQVWAAINGKPIQMVAQVIEATPKVLSMAGSADDIAENKSDLTLTMAGPIPAKLMPKVGTQITFEGTPTSYTPNPFMMQLTDGKLATRGAPAAAAPAKKPTPARKKPASH
jgi:tetratricopeptide (TPR) repeat protein